MSTAGRIGTLDVDAMIAQARASTGLEDFGAPDVLRPLHALVDSLNQEASLSPRGEAGRCAALVRALCNRLRLHEAVTREPVIERERIVPPIVIVGLPRSGTTKLQRVLAADPAMQKLPLWRLLQPVAAPALHPEQPDPRIAQAEAYVAALRENAPQMYAAHPMYAREPDEEVFVMELAFLANINATAYRAPGFDRWLQGESFDSWYVWFKRVLQYVQHADGAAGRPWVLKAPHHMGFLPLLFHQFPQAIVVHCHRDPVIAVSSFAGLAWAARRANQTRADAHEAGQYCLNYSAARLRTCVRDRAAIGRAAAFVDVAYRDIVGDWVGVVRRIYAAAGLELSHLVLGAMQAWEAANTADKHGAHRYSLGEFGLSAAQIKTAFADYLDRFGEYC